MIFSPQKLEKLQREYGRQTGGAKLVAAVARAMGEGSRRAYHVTERARSGKEVSEEIGSAFIAALTVVLGREIERDDILKDGANVAPGKDARASKATGTTH